MRKSRSTRDLCDWVAAAKAGDKEAFSEVVTRFQDMAYGIAYAMLGDAGLAQDAAQEAFTAAYLNLPTLRDPAAFPGWFRRVVIKHSDRERRSRKPSQPLDDSTEFSTTLSDPISALEALEEKSAIHNAIAELPPIQGQIISLFYLRDYSQNEIEDFLELPLRTIKKHLFNARKKLRGRLETMIETQIQSNRPSQTGVFADDVRFLLALRTGDLKNLKSMVERQPDLLEKRFETRATRERHYWPIGGTALHWSVVAGNEALLRFLLSRKVNIDVADKYGMTPLHTAVWMRQEAIVNQLLQAASNPNTVTDNGHTPPHFAAMRSYGQIANLLIETGARPDIADKNGRTPLDWAVLKTAGTVIETLAHHGAEQPAIAESLTRSTGSHVSFMETGIKVIDLFAPLLRGGRNGILTPHSNVGSFVVLTEMILRMDALYGSRTLCVGLDDEIFTRDDVQLLLRDAGVSDAASAMFGNVNESAQERSTLLDLALEKAKDLRAEGKEVLLVVMNQITLYQELLNRLKVVAGDAGMTTIYFGTDTAGAEPGALADLDAVIGFDFGRAKRALYPAVDPINSRSRLLQEGIASKEHQELAATAKRLLRRFQDLQPIIEGRGIDLLPQDDDRRIIERAKRLDRFLTQPFHWTEPWTNSPGVHVPLGDTLAGCRAILAGECDDMPEEAFYFVGNLEDAREKAHRARTTVEKAGPLDSGNRAARESE